MQHRNRTMWHHKSGSHSVSLLCRPPDDEHEKYHIHIIICSVLCSTEHWTRRFRYNRLIKECFIVSSKRRRMHVVTERVHGMLVSHGIYLPFLSSPSFYILLLSENMCVPLYLFNEVGGKKVETVSFFSFKKLLI